MARRKSVNRGGGGGVMSKDLLSSYTFDPQKGDKDLSKGYRDVQEFEKQLDEDMRVTNEDLKREFQI